jgi:SPP1 gp7 family putative phage head morphogenesis protein
LYVERLDIVVDNAIEEAVDIYSDFITHIKGVLATANDYYGAVSRLDSFLDEDFLIGFSKLLQEAFETSDALGRTVVVEKDRKYSGITNASLLVLAPILASSKPIRIAFDLIPREALEYIRFKALTIAGVEHASFLEAIKNSIESAIRNGTPFNEWKLAIDKFFDSYGVTRLSSHHLQTVYRTNIFSAYSVAAQSQVESMVDRFPYWQYSAIRDNRTRPEHRELDRWIFPTGEGPIPPIDYNCRCTQIYIHASEATRRGINVPSGYARTPDGRVILWSNPGFVRFNTRLSFEQWRVENQVTPRIQQWIQNHL